MASHLDVLRKIKLSQIRTPSSEPLWPVDEKVVENIRETLNEFGQYAPVIVSETEDGFVLADGRHRVDAARREGHEEIWAVALETGAEAELIGLSANLSRRRLSGPEFEAAMNQLQALLARRRQSAGGGAPPVTKRQIAAFLGSNTTDVKRARAVEKKLTAPCRSAFEEGKISKSTAYELSKLEPEAQAKLLPQALGVKEGKLSRNALRELVTDARPAAAPRSSNVSEFPRARWVRFIDRSDTPDDDLKALPAAHALGLYEVACELAGRAERMKTRLQGLGLIQDEVRLAASGVKP